MLLVWFWVVYGYITASGEQSYVFPSFEDKILCFWYLAGFLNKMAKTFEDRGISVVVLESVRACVYVCVYTVIHSKLNSKFIPFYI